ncbi:penicillin-binding protein 1A [Thiohalorhabdus denitrificans]|uniref:penicillin-binding protein 1A n=1 Tax=Thiohalorhabdus denitrificans TaxID=381306 RepID=UPI0006D56DBD|nr:penicillin-binding protein 1A [Thiohalorhabdus denitrificans]
MIASGVFLLIGAVSGFGGYLWLSSQLPPITKLTNYEPQTPMRVFARDGQLIGEFGSQRRLPLPPEAIPEQLKDAFLAAEDSSFFDHPGIDVPGIIRALIADIKAGAPVQGASTITQQVARTFLLTRERKIMRKLKEMLLAFRIEERLTKAEILHLYLNQIYLGNGAYGVEAAAQNYYGKSVHELTLAERAMIGGLPKAPSGYNPVNNPERARERRDYVLRRLRDTGKASPKAVEKALATPVHARSHSPVTNPMPQVAEEVRRRMVERVGKERAYTEGFRVFTTVDPDMQHQARKAVQKGLLDYTYRHGYRGPEDHWDLEELVRDTALPGPTTESGGGTGFTFDRPGAGVGIRQALLERLAKLRPIGPLQTGVVLYLGTGEGEEDTAAEEDPPRSARVLLADGREITLSWDGIRWARPYKSPTERGPEPETAAEVLSPGDVIRLEKRPNGPWFLSQVPKVQGAFVAMDPPSGQIRAMIGGFDEWRSHYNRATQARRQPGSSFKPFLYAAGLSKGMTPATLINDAPIVFEDEALETRWRPENYSQKFYGPTRLRQGLEHSRNLVTIRLMRNIGTDYALDFASRFGFDRDVLPRNLSLSLGSASVAPMDVVRGYAVFANGGLQVDPILIERIEDRHGQPVTRNLARSGCIQCHRAGSPGELDPEAQTENPEMRFHPSIRPERVLSPQVNYQMVSMLRGVVERGTGWRAKRLGLPLAGKTGTSNAQRDAWFLGFSSELVGGAYVGFDKPKTLGSHETGSRAAAPIWVDFMRQTLKGREVREFEQPEGVVNVRIDAETGKLAAPWSEETLFEYFRKGNAPTETTPRPASVASDGGSGEEENDRGGGSGERRDSGSSEMMDDLF